MDSVVVYFRAGVAVDTCPKGVRLTGIIQRT